MSNIPTVVSVINLKGGVGKTTVTALLARYAAHKWGLDTLAVDLDPQANLSQALMTEQGDKQFMDAKQPSIVELFDGFAPATENKPSPTRLEPADIIKQVFAGGGQEKGKRDNKTMKQQQLQETLKGLIECFGYDNVSKTLKDMQSEKPVIGKQKTKIYSVTAGENSKKQTKKSIKPNAVNVVKSLDITNKAKKEILFTMAKKYEAKEFMPNVNHVRAFLSDKRDVSRIKSRQQVTVAVFKKLHDLKTSELREIMDRGLYAPPKRLEAFAKAIEGFSRHDRST